MSDVDGEELGGLAALARRLPREVPPPPDLWGRIAARLEPRDRLDHLAASLPAEIDPPADLWLKIEARIAAKPRARHAAIAVAVCLAVMALVAIGVQVGAPHRDGAERGSPPVVADDASSAARNVGWILDAPALTDDVARDLSRELALVRDERLSIERAIANDPDNVDLRELWAFAYETELELADTCGRAVMEYQRARG